MDTTRCEHVARRASDQGKVHAYGSDRVDGRASQTPASNVNVDQASAANNYMQVVQIAQVQNQVVQRQALHRLSIIPLRCPLPRIQLKRRLQNR